MRDRYEIDTVWECPVCGRQTATLTIEKPLSFVPVCSKGHRVVEMEQRNREAFRTQFQHSSMPDFPPESNPEGQ